MSTKTSIKRIALVAVSALGFGLLSVAPSNATYGASKTLLLGTATIDNAVTTLAGRVGQEVSITITGDVAALDLGTGTEGGLSVAAAITSQPSGSAVYPTLTGSASADLGGTVGYTTTTVGLLYDDADGSGAGLISTGTASSVATLNYSEAVANHADNADIVAADNETLGTLTFTPTHAGTYSVTVWNEADRCSATISCATSGAGGTITAPTQASLSGSESFRTFTIVVSSGVSKITLSPVNTNAAAYVSTGGSEQGLSGSLIKVSLTDAAGNAAILAPGETVTLTPSGNGDIDKVNNVGVTSAAGAAYNLASTDFNAQGVAWINMINASAAATNLTASIAGGANASTTVTYWATVDVAAAPAPVATSGFAGTTPNFTVPTGASTFSWKLAATSGSAHAFVVEEAVTGTVGAITGYVYSSASPEGMSYDAVGFGSTTLEYASVSVTASASAASTDLYFISGYDADGDIAASGNGAKLTTAARTLGAVSVSPSLVNAVAGSSNTLTVTVKDNFGVVYPYQTVSASVTGKNPTASARTAVTDVDGLASFTFTDANTTTAVSDVVTFTAGSAVTSTITYGTNAVGKVALEYPGDTDVVAGTTTTDIVASATGATGASATVTATITGSAGALLSGVPVTFAVSGLTGAEVHTTKVTVYTNTTGKASTSISSYAAGKAVVTATAGGVSATADIYFKQQTPTEARTIAAAVSGNVVTATVSDRYGNPVEGVDVNATRTGTGYFGSGASTSTGKTDKNGKVEFIYTGTGTVTVAFTTADYGQSADAAAKVGVTAVTAYTAGTTTANQKGLGGSLAPAGVNSASVSVTSVDPAAAAAEAASDAALEAIDAANAATDAANLAAEAADAATVAAEEARDAADAATAAVEALASEVATLIAGLKAQITTLANTVAKIAKRVRA